MSADTEALMRKALVAAKRIKPPVRVPLPAAPAAKPAAPAAKPVASPKPRPSEADFLGLGD